MCIEVLIQIYLGDRLPTQAGLMVKVLMWHVYFIKSSRKRSYYVGSSNDVNRRLLEHNHGKVTSTKSFIPLKIVWVKAFETKKDCRNYEKLLKRNRIEKERIIREEIEK